jgi:hypothetical protein
VVAAYLVSMVLTVVSVELAYDSADHDYWRRWMRPLDYWWRRILLVLVPTGVGAGSAALVIHTVNVAEAWAHGLIAGILAASLLRVDLGAGKLDPEGVLAERLNSSGLSALGVLYGLLRRRLDERTDQAIRTRVTMLGKHTAKGSVALTALAGKIRGEIAREIVELADTTGAMLQRRVLRKFNEYIAVVQDPISSEVQKQRAIDALEALCINQVIRRRWRSPGIDEDSKS